MCFNMGRTSAVLVGQEKREDRLRVWTPYPSSPVEHAGPVSILTDRNDYTYASAAVKLTPVKILPHTRPRVVAIVEAMRMMGTGMLRVVQE